MTEISPPRAQNHLQLDASTILQQAPPPSTNGYSPVAENGDEEEYSTIKCICGFDEDDGNTVFCEECKTWQHIECYYPGKPVLGDQDIHFCVDCKPRSVDVNGATQRQQTRLGLVASGERKVKRAPKTTQKKRVKDATATNGLRASNAALAQDRGSGSPRDQPPPAKRPKTSHKSSSSTSVPNTAISQRKRTGSTVTGRSPIKRQQSPPLYRGDYYAPSFMNLYRNNKFTEVRNNSYSSLSLPNEMKKWLSDPETLSRHTNRPPAEIFQRWVKPIEELEQMSPGVSKRTDEDTSFAIHGLHPIFARLTVDQPAAPNTYIGELKGEIVRKEEYYMQDRWAELHHPEPFVFFHDSLPILIDSRREGTTLRYIRRSCDPNVKMQIIVLNQEYHFCLVSTREILDNEEITIGWTLPEKAHYILANWGKHGLDPADEEYMVTWAGGILSTFGGCACGRPQGSCPLERFDRRVHPNAPATAEKPFKLKKTKKNGLHISPSSTGHATNSRAASEAVNGDIDDDNADARSLSASSRSKPTSRDITPTVGVGLGVELSDREKRKLRQEEKLFEQLEFQEQQGGKKKKRNSAGSALNTPALGSSKQLGFPDSANPSPTATLSLHRLRINGTMPIIRSGNSANGSGTPSVRQKPVYADASTQVKEEELRPTSSPPNVSLLRKCRGSHIQRLLKASQAERERRARLMSDRKASFHASPASHPTSPMDTTPTGMKQVSTATSMLPPPLPQPGQSRRSPSPARPTPPPKQEESGDVDMEDVDDNTTAPDTVLATPYPPLKHHMDLLKPNPNPVEERSPSPLPVLQAEMSTQEDEPLTTVPSSLPSEHNSASLPDQAEPALIPSKTPALHVKLPPAPSFTTSLTAQTPTTPSVAGTPTPGSASLHSPMTLQNLSPSLLTNPSLLSPSLTAPNVAPSPQKKKMSLSDYTRKKKSQLAQKVVGGGPSSSSVIIPSDATSGQDLVSSPTITEEAFRTSGNSSSMGDMQRNDSVASTEDAEGSPIQLKSESSLVHPALLAESSTSDQDIPVVAAIVEVPHADPPIAQTAPTAPMGMGPTTNSTTASTTS